MKKCKKNEGTEPIKEENRLLQAEGTKRAARYNQYAMEMNTAADRTGFSRRLSLLRTEKRISAREMSLSLGQGASYINDIENGRTLPSMGMFFEICEYLKVSPYEFFAYTGKESSAGGELAAAIEHLKETDAELVAEIIKRFVKKD